MGNLYLSAPKVKKLTDDLLDDYLAIQKDLNKAKYLESNRKKCTIWIYENNKEEYDSIEYDISIDIIKNNNLNLNDNDSQSKISKYRNIISDDSNEYEINQDKDSIINTDENENDQNNKKKELYNSKK
jgi:hypothetical protein